MTAPAAALMLTWPVVLVVLFGALLHASWNVLVKSSTDKALRYGTHPPARFADRVTALLLVVGLPGAASWPYILASVVIHRLLHRSRAPTNMAIWDTYPLMRGVAPMLVRGFCCDDGGRVAGADGLGGRAWHLRWRTGAPG